MQDRKKQIGRKQKKETKIVKDQRGGIKKYGRR